MATKTDNWKIIGALIAVLSLTGGTYKFVHGEFVSLRNDISRLQQGRAATDVTVGTLTTEHEEFASLHKEISRLQEEQTAIETSVRVLAENQSAKRRELIAAILGALSYRKGEKSVGALTPFEELSRLLDEEQHPYQSKKAEKKVNTTTTVAKP